MKPVASLDSSIRSAARATYSAYKRQPIRWRLAGGSAALTLVILLGFAVIVGTLTTRAIYKDFNRQVSSAADRLQSQQYYEYAGPNRKGDPTYKFPIDLNAYAAPTTRRSASSRAPGATSRRSKGAPNFGPPRQESDEINGWKVETRELQIYVDTQLYPGGEQYDFRIFAQYGRRISDVRATANRVKLFLGLGVLGGTALALLAGLATARRAMEPIAELTEAAREIERTRDPAGSIPRPQADDEVAELSTTLESMLHALDDARTETEAALVAPARVRRRRLARAAHAADVRAGQPRAARGDAGRRAPRGRGLRAALEPPDAPAGRRPAAARPRRHRPRAAAAHGRPLERRHRRRLRARAGGGRPRDLDLGARAASRSRACRTSCTGSCST